MVACSTALPIEGDRRTLALSTGVDVTVESQRQWVGPLREQWRHWDLGTLCVYGVAVHHLDEAGSF